MSLFRRKKSAGGDLGGGKKKAPRNSVQKKSKSKAPPRVKGSFAVEPNSNAKAGPELSKVLKKALGAREAQEFLSYRFDVCFSFARSSLTGPRVNALKHLLKDEGLSVCSGEVSNVEVKVKGSSVAFVFLSKDYIVRVQEGSRDAPSLERTEFDTIVSSLSAGRVAFVALEKEMLNRAAWPARMKVFPERPVIDWTEDTTTTDIAREMLATVSDYLDVPATFGGNRPFDIYISHEWSGVAHPMALNLASLLQKRGFRVWVDAIPGGYPDADITRWISTSRSALVMVSRRFIQKVTSGNPQDNLRKEFLRLVDVLGPDKIIPLIVDESGRNVETWRKPMTVLTSNATVDMTSLEDLDARILEVEALLEGMGVVPAMGVVSDTEIRQAFEAVLKTAVTQEWGRAKMMIIGQGAAGKTSTVRSLLGMPPVEAWNSTVGIDLKVTRAEDWIEHSLEESDFDSLAHRAAANKILEQQRREQEAAAAAASAKSAEAKKGQGRKGALASRLSQRLSSRGKKKERKHALERNEQQQQQQQQQDASQDVDDDEELAEALQAIDLLEEKEVAKRFDVEWAKRYVDRDQDDQEKNLSFSIWDYGGQEVFYALHHIFLTQYGLYLLVFDMRQILENRAEALRYMRFWLNSVKLYAPEAPLLLVGTYLDKVSTKKQHKEIDLVLRDELGLGKYSNVVLNNQDKLRFFPIDNGSKDVNRGGQLRHRIEEEALKQPYVHREVSLRWMKVLDELLGQTEKSLFTLDEVAEISSKYNINMAQRSDMLSFFHELGVVVNLRQTERLANVVVTQPQWLLDNITKVICDEIHIDQMYFDEGLQSKGLVEDFDTLRTRGIASKRLLEHLWGIDHVDYLIDFMRQMMLACDWSFDKKVSYLVTSLLMNDSQIDPGDFKTNGLCCVLDFSAFYLPEGVFQRLVSICAEYSAQYEDSMEPQLSHNRAVLSFGLNDFLLETDMDQDRILIWIPKDSNSVAETIKTLVSMFQFLNDVVMRNLQWQLCLVSPNNAEVIVPYDALNKARADGKKQIRANRQQRHVAVVADFEPFFRDEATFGPLNDDSDGPESAASTAARVSAAGARAVVGTGTDFSYHCFISHKQSSGGDVAGLLAEKLHNRGLKIWLDQDQRVLTKEEMAKGIEGSQGYLLLLTKEVFRSESVLFELKTALRLEKNVVMVHESDPTRDSYAPFSSYIESCPKDLRSQLFDQVESLPFQRRFFLERPFLEELIIRIMAL